LKCVPPSGVGETDPEELCAAKELFVLDWSATKCVPESDSSNPAFCILSAVTNIQMFSFPGDPEGSNEIRKQQKLIYYKQYSQQ
jgi:hypothetical protein